mmetsp:Transcript_66748/g.159294  ORF Transcript_66748/g.159294 Transcript_66748/m.159294 type:complete len:235 (-) Transcript_66748:158-862(-)
MESSAPGPGCFFQLIASLQGSPCLPSPPPVTPGMGSRSRRSRSSPSSCSRAGLSLCARASAAASVCASASGLPKPGFELCETFRMAAEPSASCALWPSSSLQSIVMGCLPNSSGSSPQAPSCRSPGAMVASACLAPFLLGAMVTEVQLGSLSSNFRRVEFKDFRITSLAADGTVPGSELLRSRPCRGRSSKELSCTHSLARRPGLPAAGPRSAAPPNPAGSAGQFWDAEATALN